MRSREGREKDGAGGSGPRSSEPHIPEQRAERGADECRPVQTARGGMESDRQEGGGGAWTEANPKVLQDTHGTEAQRRLGAGGGGQGRSLPRAEPLT